MPDDQLRSDLDVLRGKRIFFGHQSVGENILAGIEETTRALHCCALNIVPLGQDLSGEAWFAHSRIGHNGRPDSKFGDFRRDLERLNGGVDIALMKLCFVDFSETTDAAGVLDLYARTVAETRARYPNLRIVHVTAPVMVRPWGLKRAVKTWLGRHDDLANLKRCDFNRLLTQRFGGDPIFDLATAESTYSDGRRNTFEAQGATGLALIPDYASDGGHLNAEGRRVVARQLLRTLADVARRGNAR